MMKQDGTDRAGMQLIARSFDHPDRKFGWLDFLPQHTDIVWTWIQDSEVVSALVARPITLVNGARGVIMGAVATEQNHRRKGYASKLVVSVCGHYAELGNNFVIMWAREYLLPLYEPLGFHVEYEERFCDIAADALPDTDVPDMTVGELGNFSHAGFDRLRLKLESVNADSKGFWPVARTLEDGRWSGIMGGYPFAPRFSLIFAPSEEEPAFYAVIGHGFDAVTIMEYVGNAADFNGVVRWVQTQFSKPSIKFNITAHHHGNLLRKVSTISSEQNMSLIYRPLCPGDKAIPQATWLDRF